MFERRIAVAVVSWLRILGCLWQLMHRGYTRTEYIYSQADKPSVRPGEDSVVRGQPTRSTMMPNARTM